MTEVEAATFRALFGSLDRIDRGVLRTKDGEGRETTEETRRLYTTRIRDMLAGMPDSDLLRAFQQTVGATGNLEADPLLAEIERRGLAV